MNRLRTAVGKLARLPGLPKARSLTEHAVAPYLRENVHFLQQRADDLDGRLGRLEDTVHRLFLSVEAIETHQPAVLNAIASVNGSARHFARESAALRTAIDDGDVAVLEEIRPHLDTVAWLVERVEMVRAEMLNELHYGGRGGAPGREGAEKTSARVVDPSKLEGGPIRVNLGAGHLALDGFVNVDMRELPGIDVVAGIDDLPFEAGSLAEIFSSHTLEHFPELQLRRTLLPYWVSLLEPGGTFRAVVPDLEAMANAYSEGTISFDVLRAVTFGGQEYDGDFHYTGFTPASLSALLTDAGLEAPEVIARGRPNGDCLELEVSASKPRGG